MSKKLENKVVLITGGSSGIGFATAALFVDEGAHVYITGRREPELVEAVKKIGGQVTAISGDVSNLADIDKIYEQIKKEKGKLDILVANAASAIYLPIHAVSEQDYNTMFDVNVKGVYFTVQKALPLLVDGASVILTASVVSGKGAANNGVYSATKAAVRSFARSMTSDLKHRGIRVNAVSPGATETEGLMNLLNNSGEAGKKRAETFKTMIPMGRLGRPEETAKAILFLASDDSSYITGVELSVDGGWAQV